MLSAFGKSAAASAAAAKARAAVVQRRAMGAFNKHVEEWTGLRENTYYRWKAEENVGSAVFWGVAVPVGSAVIVKRMTESDDVEKPARRAAALEKLDANWSPKAAEAADE